MRARLNIVGLHLKKKKKNVPGSAGECGLCQGVWESVDCARDAGTCGLCQGCGNVWVGPGSVGVCGLCQGELDNMTNVSHLQILQASVGCEEKEEATGNHQDILQVPPHHADRRVSPPADVRGCIRLCFPKRDLLEHEKWDRD